jgi:hypothetical protein
MVLLSVRLINAMDINFAYIDHYFQKGRGGFEYLHPFRDCLDLQVKENTTTALSRMKLFLGQYMSPTNVMADKITKLYGIKS